MNDSNGRDDPHARRERHRTQRLERIRRWVEYLERTDPAVWGAQQNRLVDSQLESARQSGIDVTLRRRLERLDPSRSPSTTE